MTGNLSGREPWLSGALPIPSTGHEPGLGGERLIRLFRDHLLHLLEVPTTTHLRRAAIGDWLAHNGDPRPGVGLRGDGLPDLVWCEVPSGQAPLRDLSEPVTVDRFYIACYPVTWAQYRIFLDADDGHVDPQWWHGLVRRAEYEREAIKIDNYPAQEVSWYDAVAYCRWLSARIGYKVRLPAEWEWQQAASGGDPDALFPWGVRWRQHAANTRESLLRRVTSVGLYPLGESPVGALDMCGTVLEWCANQWRGRVNDPRGAAMVGLSGAHPRVLKGGSWFLTRDSARIQYSAGEDPYYRFNSVGFRLACGDPTPRAQAGHDTAGADSGDDPGLSSAHTAGDDVDAHIGSRQPQS